MSFIKPALLISFYFSIILRGVNALNPPDPPNPPHRSYLPLKQFLKSQPSLRFHLEPLELTFEIKSRSERMRFQIDSNFYTFKGLQKTTPKPPVYFKHQIYLPPELVRELEEKLNLNQGGAVSKKNRTTPSPPSASGHSKHPGQKKTSRKDQYVNTSSRLDFMIIDPGHGGRDPGAQGHNGTLEKHITLLAGKQLAKSLKKEFPKTKIILTRKKDRFISLERRSQIANRYESGGRFGIFLSLHCNATFTPRSRGFEIYYLSRHPSNEEARLLTIRENLSSRDSKNVRKFKSYLLDAQIQKESRVFALELHRAFKTRLSKLVNSRGIRRADFSVIRGVSMPALLIELGYITNAYEAKLLKSKHYLSEMSQAVAKGIRSFLRKRPKL